MTRQDCFDAVQALFPERRPDDEVHVALESMWDECGGNVGSRRGAGDRWQEVYDQVANWYRTGGEFEVDPARPESVAAFALHHRRACTWAVLLRLAYDAQQAAPQRVFPGGGLLLGKASL